MRIMMILLAVVITAGTVFLLKNDETSIKDNEATDSQKIADQASKAVVEQIDQAQSVTKTDHSKVENENISGGSSKGEPLVNEEEVRRELMQSKFSDLKEVRKKTKMQLSRLSSRLRRSEFPPEQARSISQDMLQAGYMLKNPRLLGAFSSPEEIDQELEQLAAVKIKLDAIKQALDDKKKN